MRQLKIYLLFINLCLFAIYAGGQGMIVQPDIKVTVESGTTLDISGGNLILLDNYSSVPSFLERGSLTFSGGGKAYVEQYLTKDVWHIVAEPVNNEVIGVFLWMYLCKYIEQTNTWQYLNLPVTLPLNIGEGYFVWAYKKDPNGLYPASPDSVVFGGMLNDQDVNIALSNTPASPNSGWNLIGNPYPCAIEWNGDADWNLNNVGATVYICDGGKSGNYKVWNYNSGGTLSNGDIVATQGFWVRTADTTGTIASLTIPASQRLHSSEPFNKSSGPLLPEQLKLKVERNEKTDETIIGFMTESTANFDPDYDGLYLYGVGDNPAIYSVIYNAKYVLNQLPCIEDYKTVPVNFEAKDPGNYTLTVSWIESFSEDIPVYLEDKQESIFWNLRENSVYAFASVPSDEPERFSIHFAEPLNVNYRTVLVEVNIYSWQKTVYVNIPFEINGKIMIYNLLGKAIASQKAERGMNKITINDVKGNYFVRLTSDQGYKVSKIYIN